MLLCGKCGATDSGEFHASVARRNQSSWCKACYREWHRSRYTPRAGATDDARPCKQCGVVYSPGQRRPSLFCSPKCKRAAQYVQQQAAVDAAKPDRVCIHCTKPVSKRMRADARFCSEECNSAAHAITRKMAQRAGTDRPDKLFSVAYVAERDRFRCHLCGGKVSMARRHPDPLAPSIDHVVPVSVAGAEANALSNLRLAHLRCNLAKGNRAKEEQLLLLG